MNPEELVLRRWLSPLKRPGSAASVVPGRGVIKKSVGINDDAALLSPLDRKGGRGYYWDKLMALAHLNPSSTRHPTRGIGSSKHLRTDNEDNRQ
ncbi:hypothetical protein FRC08_006051 [Ceratobasidium sp. 394]|nr:hypothetical protein FRC08_006051 [Ceratobasidium sp. 394]